MPDIYEATEIFNNIYTRISEKKIPELKLVAEKFTGHLDLLTAYLGQLNSIKELMTEKELDTTRKHFLRENLIFIHHQIGKMVAEKPILERDQEMKDKLKDTEDLFIPGTSIEIEGNEELTKLHQTNLQVYVNKIAKKFKDTNEKVRISNVLGPLDYAENERVAINDKSLIYFKKEICDIEKILGKAIVFMVGKSLND